MSKLKVFLAIIFLSIFASTAFAQSNAPKVKKKKSKKITVLVGATNVVDYRDTFKVNDLGVLNPLAELKNVKVGRIQDSIDITILLLDANPKGQTIKLKENKPFDSLLQKKALIETRGWVNPSKDFSKSFVHSNGYKVEIQAKGFKEKFYGILEFNLVYNACAGDPSARSYFIRIPKSFLYNAMGGNISVVYEYYECAPRLGSKTVRDYTTKKSRYTSWVLWISDISFDEDQKK